MGGGTPSKLLEPSSQISTNFQCDNCHVTLNEVSWKQCNKCHGFNLCNQCAQIDYDKLIPVILDDHKQFHKLMELSELITDEDIKSISVVEAEPWANKLRYVRIETGFKRIVNQKRIENDYDMSIVLDMLKKNKNLSIFADAEPSDINSMIAGYHIQAHKTKIHILSLDGGGIRGYMPIQVLCQLITEKYLSDVENFDSNNVEHRKRFKEGQLELTNQFDYIVGTSTGGLIAFCLAINHDILDIKKIYEQSSFYFKRNRFGPYLWDKYDPIHIHNQIDDIINTIKWPYEKQLTAENGTLLDIHNLLNPQHVITDDMLANDKLGKTLICLMIIG